MDSALGRTVSSLWHRSVIFYTVAIPVIGQICKTIAVYNPVFVALSGPFSGFKATFKTISGYFILIFYLIILLWLPLTENHHDCNCF